MGQSGLNLVRGLKSDPFTAIIPALILAGSHDADVGPNRSQGSGPGESGKIADPHFDEHGFVGQVWKDLSVINPNPTRSPQFNSAHDAIPTGGQ